MSDFAPLTTPPCRSHLREMFAGLTAKIAQEIFDGIVVRLRECILSCAPIEIIIALATACMQRAGIVSHLSLMKEVSSSSPDFAQTRASGA